MRQLHIIDISKNADTGLITVEARIVESLPDGAGGWSSRDGAVERWHVEALDISDNYGGQVERWLQHIGRQMLNRHKLRTAAHDDLHKWHGQKIDITG